jgi:TrmH family RNA methyltransferase
VQLARSLVRQRKAREQTGLFVLEGAGLVAEALSCGHVPVDVFVSLDAPEGDLEALLAELRRAGAAVAELDPTAFASIASTVTPQPVIATVAQPWSRLEEAVTRDGSFVLVAAGVREPGNAGTLIRTAAAAGADAIVFCDDPVDVANPKAVRASAGAIFRIPVVARADVGALWERLEHCGLTSVGMSGSSERAYDAVDYTMPVAIVVGNEAHGISDPVAAHLAARVAIPMARGVESLNVAAAAAVVVFEAARQRRVAMARTTGLGQ